MANETLFTDILKKRGRVKKLFPDKKLDFKKYPTYGMSKKDSDYETLKKAIFEISLELAQAIIRDGEGASKFITIEVLGGNSSAECKKVGMSIAKSPLVKTL